MARKREAAAPAVMRLQTDGFPVALHRRLKGVTGYSGMSMKDAVIEAVTDWCASQETERGKPGNASGQGPQQGAA